MIIVYFCSDYLDSETTLLFEVINIRILSVSVYFIHHNDAPARTSAERIHVRSMGRRAPFHGSEADSIPINLYPVLSLFGC